MAIAVRPERGGFLRPFGCGWFIREFLLGHGPEGSTIIDPNTGACQVDISHYYKLALHKACAEGNVNRENELRIKDSFLRNPCWNVRSRWNGEKIWGK